MSLDNIKNSEEINNLIRQGKISELHRVLGYREDLVRAAFDNYNYENPIFGTIFRTTKESNEK